MTRVILMIREPGQLSIAYGYHFDLPEVPRVGDYISVSKLDVRQPLGDDFIVRKIWWRLKHPGGVDDVGEPNEICVECDIACGPYATRDWKKWVRAVRNRGVSVEDFEVGRITVFFDNDITDGKD